VPCDPRRANRRPQKDHSGNGHRSVSDHTDGRPVRVCVLGPLRFGQEVKVETVEVLGTHPQPARYYFRLAAGTFRTMLDVGMLALGTGMVGLAIALLLDAFDLADIGMPLSTTSLLGSALVIGIVGAFALGIASEGGYGAPESVRRYPVLEIALGRLLGAILVGIILVTVASRLEGFVAEFSLPLRAAHEMVRAVGTAGLFVVPILGLPLAYAIRMGLERLGWGEEFELPAMYIVWTIATLVLYSMPAP